MDIILDILTVIGALCVAIILFGGILIFLGWVFGNSKIVEYPVTYIEECKGNCQNCNEELKSVCEEINI